MKYLKIYSREQSLPNTLLIIDDDAVNRMILKEIFQDAYTIIEAENGREGLASGEGLEQCLVLPENRSPGIEVFCHLFSKSF